MCAETKGNVEMTADFFRARLEQMIDLKHPMTLLARRLRWGQIEKALAPSFARKERSGKPVEGSDLFGPTVAIAGDGISNSGRPKLSIRLMAFGETLSGNNYSARMESRVRQMNFAATTIYIQSLILKRIIR
jgi:hypothetical protein